MNRYRLSLSIAVVLSLAFADTPISSKPLPRTGRTVRPASAANNNANTNAPVSRITTRRIRAARPTVSDAPPPQTPLQSAWLHIIDTPALRHASISAYAYDLTTHRPLAAIHSNWRETPASVMKLFTSAAALHTLGPSYQYRTEVRVGPSSGRTPPTLYLVGGGDPWLEADGARNLENMAKIISRSVHNAYQVVGVGAAFAGSPHGVGWTWDDLPWNWAPNISSLTAERDQLNLLVKPAARPGLPPICTVNPLNPSIDPGPPFLVIRNRARTVVGTAANTLSATRRPGSNVVTVTGNLPIGSESNNFFSLHNPALLASTLFQTLLQQDGVHFAHSPGTGSLPSGTRNLMTHLSPKLAVYLQIQNTFSINLMAENLFRTLGARDGGNGSSRSASAMMQDFVQQAGLSTHYVQVDGSGLSPFDEVSAAQVVDLLRYAHTQPWFTTFEHSLIHIGRTNQCSFMCGLMDYTPADGRVWLKTGNLGNQWNYAGYAQAQNGNLIAFAILVNGLRTNQYFQQASGPEDAMTVATASWPHLAAAPSAPPPVSATPPALLANLLPQYVSAHDVVSGQIVNVRTGQLVSSYNSHLRLDPGLLARLPALFTYLANQARIPLATTVYRTGPISSGILHGSIVLSGAGSPFAQSGKLQTLARSVTGAGIQAISGTLQYTVDNRASGLPPSLPPSLPWEDFPQASTQSPVHAALARAPGAATGSAAIGVANPTGDAARGLQAAQRFASDLHAMGVRIGNLHLLPVAAAPTASRIASLPSSSPAQITRDVLTHASAQTPLALARKIFHRLPASAITAGPLGAADLLPDLSGLGLENYMTAASVSRLLRAAWNRPSERSIARTLGTDRLWISTTPEQWSAAGYIASGGQIYAVNLIVNGLPWNGSFSPTVGWQSTPARW